MNTCIALSSARIAQITLAYFGRIASRMCPSSPTRAAGHVPEPSDGSGSVRRQVLLAAGGLIYASSMVMLDLMSGNHPAERVSFLFAINGHRWLAKIDSLWLSRHHVEECFRKVPWPAKPIADFIANTLFVSYLAEHSFCVKV